MSYTPVSACYVSTCYFPSQVGLLRPSEGRATVAGFDIRTDMHRIYGIMGVCPQVTHILPALYMVPNDCYFDRGLGTSWVRTGACTV